MNERIDEIAFEAGCHRHKYWDPKHPDLEGFIISQATLDKFAELIVKEYEKLLPEICPWADANKEGPMKGWHVEFVARKHFGVEE